MAMNPMKRKATNAFFTGFLLSLIIFGIVVVFIIMNLNKTTSSGKDDTVKSIYVLNKSINSGIEITKADLVQANISGTILPTNALEITKIEGMIAKINLSVGSIITSDMVVQSKEELVTNDVRLQEYNMLVLPSKLDIGAYIDIRIMLPSGLDYIVIAKKRVIDVSTTTVWIEMSELETLTMSNAIVESYVMTGSALYANKYIEPGNQEVASQTYLVKASVANLIVDNPNVVKEAKEALIARQQGSLKQHRDNIINTELGNFSVTAQTSVEQKVLEQITKQQTERSTFLKALNGIEE